MPARPLSDGMLHLIDAVRDALAQRCGAAALEERSMFGGRAFLVDGKLCVGVKGEELLVRLPPERHGEFQEMQNTRELSPGGGMQGYFWIEPHGYARAAQWAFWLDEALAYNPRAKASPKRRTAARKAPQAPTAPAAKAPATPRRHSIFEADD
ncbi:TfoX/Sxy family protein [Paracidovorax cattleyae]|uniref:TfoX N-terminal domain-containing protein n=1 Tax=Paracidovorax cattleyae TaxID=80868 RepID=A0A1H0SUC0_9BURK|nr:TfoX/Sxy family protein [Paracidovorax cattleyae]AVS74587.1 transcriptional regulator [Paracidovorax cattleyae]MBF9264042.1 TfoX/Sxy family protein [Paracidovorax cattleyae]SDP45387.1 TfoX N-terminal domain-containing protein [Paracidovorax cattleyae]